MRKVDLAVLPLLFIASVFYLFYFSFGTFAVLFFIGALPAVLIALLVYFYIPITIFGRMAKYHETYSLIFSEEGIEFKTKTIDSSLKWAVYSEMPESDDFYFLIQAPQVYTLIPKRLFSSETQMAAFGERVKTRIKSARKV